MWHDGDFQKNSNQPLTVPLGQRPYDMLYTDIISQSGCHPADFPSSLIMINARADQRDERAVSEDEEEEV